MSNWRNLREVIQDLERAQGGAVPARLEVITGDGPPPLNIPDQGSMLLSKYDYESDCLGAGGDLPAPDYEQIQKMLDMVKNHDNQDNDPVNSSYLDPNSPEFMPARLKRKTSRNVALSSIITAKEAESRARRPLPKSIIPVMFKRKNEGGGRENVSPSPSSTSQTSQTSSPEKSKQYIPSARAQEYYNNYLEKSKIKEQIGQDIWDRAEKQMKKIDAQKKLAADLNPQERGNTSPPDVACAAFDLKLAEHRHQMLGDCIVCIVAAKHGYYF